MPPSFKRWSNARLYTEELLMVTDIQVPAVGYLMLLTRNNGFRQRLIAHLFSFCNKW